MTQRIFDVENEKDMADLWNILPKNIVKIRKGYKSEDGYYFNFYDTNNTTGFYETFFLNINWHDKREINRPIKEATEADIGKLCVFWNDINRICYGVLAYIVYSREMPYYATNVDGGSTFNHCRRLTKQEIEELC